MNVELARRHLISLRRAWAGANLCRERLADREQIAPVINTGGFAITDLRGLPSHDVDYYAWESVRIVNIANKTVAAGLRGHDKVTAAVADLDDEAPLLRDFRNAVTHPEDNRGADDIVYFGDAVRLLSGGDVQYVVDPRYRQHDLLGAVVDAAGAALLTLAPQETDE